MTPLFFSQSQLDEQIARVLPMIPADHDQALIGTVDDTGAQAVLVVRLHPGPAPTADRTLAISGVVRHDWTTGDNSVGASVIYSWKN